MTPELEDLIMKHLLTPRMEAAIAEIKDLIRRRYPEVTFDLYVGEDPVGLYLIPIVDRDDLDEVADVFSDRLVDLQVDERLDLYVIPDRTPERNARIAAEQAVERALLVP
jgi:hypothetical protein